MDDLDHISDVLDEESIAVHEPVAVSEQSVESTLEQEGDLKDTFVRYVDFLREKAARNQGDRSKRAMAWLAYEHQAKLYKDDAELLRPGHSPHINYWR